MLSFRDILKLQSDHFTLLIDLSYEASTQNETEKLDVQKSN